MAARSPLKTEPGDSTFVLVANLRELRTKRHFSQRDLAVRARCSLPQIKKLERVANQRIRGSTGRSLAEALGVSISVLKGEKQQPAAISTPRKVLSWQIVIDGPWQTASNGIQWKQLKVCHEAYPSRLRRAKVYDLREFHSSQKNAFEELRLRLQRHGEVYERIGDHPNLAKNYDLFADPGKDGLMWALDEWIDGPTLSERLRHGALAKSDLYRCMSGIAAGLEALHLGGAIARDLSPKRIYVTDERVVLTDFEVTKLIGVGATVAPARWDDDPYRAPEVSDKRILDRRCDMFSWSMIFAAALRGDAPHGPDDAEAWIKCAGLPRALTNYLLKCLDEVKNRPSGFRDAIAVLENLRAEWGRRA
jgi:serine/threonine protein kinase